MERTKRPHRVKELLDWGLEAWEVDTLTGPNGIRRLGHGIVGRDPDTYSRIAIALVRVRVSVATLHSSLFLHGLLAQEPSLAWICVPHKGWVPRLPERSPIRVMRTTFWDLKRDAVAVQGLPCASLARTAVDFVRYRRHLPPHDPDRAVGLILDSGKCTQEEVRACAARLRVDEGAFGPASGLHPAP